MTHRTIEVGDIVSILIGEKSYQHPITTISQVSELQKVIFVRNYQVIYVK
jgi:hypothetical protein